MKGTQARTEPQHRVGTPFTDAELKRIDDWGFARRIRTRTEAIRQLVEIGLAGEMAAAGAKFGDQSPAAAGNTSDQEITDA